MKIYITAAICVGAALLVAGCDPSPSAVKAPVAAAKVDAPSVPKTAPSEVMTRLKEPAFRGVDAINGVTSPKASTVVEITGDKIRDPQETTWDAVHPVMPPPGVITYDRGTSLFIRPANGG